MKSLLYLLCLLSISVTSHAMSVVAETPDQKAIAADAICTANLVISQGRLKDGRIQTRFLFQTTESIKGDFPAYFEVYAPGGTYLSEAVADSRLPSLTTETVYLLHLQINDNQLGFYNGPVGATPVDSTDLPALRILYPDSSDGADISPFKAEAMSVEFSVTSSGLLDTDGFRRFILADRNETIPVYADTSTLPSGITEQVALTALDNAMAVWEANSSIRFEYIGTDTFSQSAEDYGSSDGLVIRVQFHDNFNRISDNSTTLGFGGSGYSLNLGSGGTVNGNSFNHSNFGYVVLNHPKASLENSVKLEAVLTHEIGHVIGLAHSSETENEPDETLAEATMYFSIHNDDRGATLNTYDISTALKAYPLDTPPFAYDRVFYAVTSPSGSLTNPEVNQVTIEGFDLQGDSLTLQLDSTSNLGTGSFAISSNTVTFTPSGYFGDSTVSNPASSYYERFRGRLSDGTNLSPYIDVRVIGLRSDSQPSNNYDGIPDSWMTTYYGNSNGSNATADTDADGLNNLQEFLLGTDPTDSSSAFYVTQFSTSILEWTTQQFDVYTLESSSDLTQWDLERILTQPDTTATLSLSDLPAAGPSGAIFYRINRSQ